jgi:alkyl sulfatase BDS1-like metallo-beta-lactamase superfamily hydrolase
MSDWSTDSSVVVEGPNGQRAHVKTFEQSERLVRRFEKVRPGVWCLVGNGLSNQTFVEGPDGIVAIDTGESVEEMSAALDELSSVTDRPVVAVIYTHFHYVGGTEAVVERFGDVPIYGHERIATNRSRVSSHVGPAYMRGLAQQFATTLPLDGPDGQVNVGLGLYYRNPQHRSSTPGFRPVTHSFRGGEVLTIAGLEVHVDHAPSDADDSVTLWFPELQTCVQNIIWPLVFNVYAIRGEEYRDPLVLLPGIDRVLALEPEFMVCTHGPPLAGREEIERRGTRYRDAIQLMWDQTVRLMNRGHTMDEIAHLVELPPGSDDDYYTTEHYGLVEHHVRQIYTGLRGWFDDDPGKLLPLEPHDRAGRLIEGFGGADEVRSRVRSALAGDDLRWALEMVSWLLWSPGVSDEDRSLASSVLRQIAYRTTAANIRSWCLTKARDLDGSYDMSRFRRHRLSETQIMSMGLARSIDLLRVMVDPSRAVGLDVHVAVDVGDEKAGLHVRNCVAVLTDGCGVATTMTTSLETWARLLTGSTALMKEVDDGTVVVEGDVKNVAGLLDVFDLPGAGRAS